MPRTRAFRRVGVGAALLLAAACGDAGSPSEPEPQPESLSQSFEVENVFALAPAAEASGPTLAAGPVVEIRKIRVRVFTVPQDQVVFDKIYDVDPAAGKWTLGFSAPKGSTVRLLVELMSSTASGDRVEYTGQTAPFAMNPCQGSCAPIPVKAYPGPVENLGATSVTVTPEARTLVEGDTVRLSATVAPAGPAYRVVWRSADEAVATVAESGLVTAVRAGETRVVAMVGERRDTAVITVTPASTCVMKEYTVGSTVQGAWTATDCEPQSGSGRRYDQHRFTLAQQTRFQAEITGPEGRIVNLRSADDGHYVQTMASEAFMPRASNPLVIRYVLAPGTYYWEIANPEPGVYTDYTLKTTLDPTLTCKPLVFVTLGVTIEDSLGAGDCDGVFSGKEDWFLLLPRVGKRVDLTLETGAFAPVLAFRDDREGPASPTLTRDIRFKVGETAQTAWTTTFTGFHEIVVNNSGPALGAYKLTIGSGDPSNTCAATPGSTSFRELAYWESPDCQADGRPYDAYPITLAEQTALRTTLSSAVTGKTTGFFAGGKEVVEYIRNSEGDMNATWYLAPGAYELRAGAPTGTSGSYELTVAPGDGGIGCASNATSGNVSFSNQTLGQGDCTFETWYEDRLVLLVEKGKEIVIEMTGSMAPKVVIRDPGTPAGTFLKLESRSDPGSVTARWTVQETGYYQVIFSTAEREASGTYSGSVQVH